MRRVVDVVVISSGQAGLAAGYHLRRAGLDFVILDAEHAPGGAWRHTWDSLHLFSPAAYSSLPGRLMPSQPGVTYPDAARVVTYLADYEQRYDLPVHRPYAWPVSTVTATSCASRPNRAPGRRVRSSARQGRGRALVPAMPGQRRFRGRQLHTIEYDNPAAFAGQRVTVVGRGNSGAQVAADHAHDTDLTWVTLREPRYLADDIDGRALFDVASARRRALDEGRTDSGGIASFGDIVTVPLVRAARDAGLLKAQPMFIRLTPTGIAWADGMTAQADAIIWCTGFRPARDATRAIAELLH